MSKCIPAERDQLRALAENLGALETVLGVDLHTDDPAHGVVLDVVFRDDCDGVPPRATQLVGEARATIHSVQHQAGCPTMWVIL